jgi:hypothetical protein
MVATLAWQAGCGGQGGYCAQVAAQLNPSASYASATVADGTPFVTPIVTRNGPIAAASLVSGAIPPGTTLAADGSISGTPMVGAISPATARLVRARGSAAAGGTPTVDGVYTFTVQLTNAEGGVADCSGTITVEQAPLLLTYPSPLEFPSGQPIPPQTATLANAQPALGTWYQVTSGSLPAGLALDPATGTITGAPTRPGISLFTITASNGAVTASANLSYTVDSPGSLTLAYDTPRFFPAGAAIGAQMAMVGDATPGVATTFALTGGTLPAGLALNGDGSITGTPSATGVSSFTIQAANGDRQASASATYTIENAGSLALAYPTPETFPEGAPIPTQSPAAGNLTPGWC